MKTKTLVITAIASAILAACGGQDSGSSGTTSAPPAASPAAQAPAAAPAAEAPAAAAPAAAPAAPAAAANAGGEKVYRNTCALCHAAGVAGAPIPKDKADWGPRIEQGMDVLYKHAIEGYTGAKGVMPPRGGAASLSDDDVKSAVDHMVAIASQ